MNESDENKLLRFFLRSIILDINNAVCCPCCGNDLRTQYDCPDCEIDHMGHGCFRHGKHDDDCVVLLASNLIRE